MSEQLGLFDLDFMLDEGVNVEYKASRKDLPNDLWETYSAFANTQGGKIYLGVKEHSDGQLEISGVNDSAKLHKDFWNTINNKTKVSVNILSDEDVYIESITDKNTLGKKHVIVINVPRAKRSQRPVFINGNMDNGTYKRNHEGDYKCSPAEINKFLSERRLDEESADNDILFNFSLEDLDEKSIQQFRIRMSNRNPSHPFLLKNDKELLEALGGWRYDRTLKKGGLTSAGLLMFGKTASILDEEAYPNFQLDYREKTSSNPDERWVDRLTIDGLWEANLFQFYHRVMQKIMQDDFLKIPFSKDENGIRKGTSQVHDALEEALVNALIHADHRGKGGIVIERYKDRFEFSNPGDLLISMEQIQKGGVSECRNKKLQNMFFFGAGGDKAGSGLEKIRLGWEGQCWQPPSIKEIHKPERVYLILPLTSLLPKDVIKNLHQLFGEKISQLTQDEVHTMVYAFQKDHITNEDLQSKLIAHRVDIGKMLKGLVEKELLVAHGYGRATYYTMNRIISSPSNELSSPSNELSSPSNELSSPSKKEVFEFDSETTKLIDIYHTKQRNQPEDTVSIIIAICKQHQLTLGEIANLINKNPEYLRKFISKLVSDGKLQLRYPDKPTHSEQAYYINPRTEE